MARVLARNKRVQQGLTPQKMIEQRKLNGESRMLRAKKMVPKGKMKILLENFNELFFSSYDSRA